MKMKDVGKEPKIIFCLYKQLPRPVWFPEKVCEDCPLFEKCKDALNKEQKLLKNFKQNQ
jgi:hypothetical protein